MKDYLVKWEIDATAASPLEAARKAWRFMRNDGSIATVFNIEGQSIDFDDVYPDGRPEDLADIAPELVSLIHDAINLMPTDSPARLVWYGKAAKMRQRAYAAKVAYLD